MDGFSLFFAKKSESVDKNSFTFLFFLNFTGTQILQDFLVTGHKILKMPQYIYGVIVLATFKRKFNFDKNIKEIVSKNIKKYRLKAGITQEQLAVDIGKSYDFVRRLEFKKEKLVAR